MHIQPQVFYSTTVFRSRSLSSLNAASAVSKMRRKYERNFSSWTPASSSYLLSPYESPSQHSTGELSSAILTNDTSFSSYLKDFVAVCSNELNNTDFAKYEGTH